MKGCKKGWARKNEIEIYIETAAANNGSSETDYKDTVTVEGSAVKLR